MAVRLLMPGVKEEAGVRAGGNEARSENKSVVPFPPPSVDPQLRAMIGSK